MSAFAPLSCTYPGIAITIVHRARIDTKFIEISDKRVFAHWHLRREIALRAAKYAEFVNRRPVVVR